MKDIYSILYVDDEQINLLIFEISFKKKFKAYTANSAKRGLELLEKNPEIDVVISDINMPEMNGIEFIKLVKNKYPDIICFIISALDITNEVKSLIDKGYITNRFQKPYRAKEIENSINKAIELVK